MASETALNRVLARINELRENEPYPFNASADEVEAYIKAIAETLSEAEKEGVELNETQLRYLHEGSMREVRFARARIDHDRHTAIEILGRLFQLGHPVRPDGIYHGELIGLSTGLLADPFFDWMTRIYLPWQGKTFDAASDSGDNIFEDNTWSKATGKLGWPGYRVHKDAPPHSVRIFPFRMEAGEAVEDEGFQVTNLIYADAPNPLPVRRMVDEIVELPGGYILGKTHMRGLRELRRICFFGLTPDSAG